MDKKSHSSVIRRVPSDVWIIVFRKLRFDWLAPSGDLLACTTVCKAWAESSRRVLYEHITIHDVQQSSFLAHRLICDTHTPGKWIHELTLPSGQDIDMNNAEEVHQYLTTTHLILLRCTQLRAFRAYWPNVAVGSHLGSISAVARATLTVLDIFVNWQAVGCLPLIAQFPSLQELYIYFGATSMALPVDECPSIALPSVYSVGFKWNEGGGLGLVGRWILASKFESVHDVELSLPPMESNEAALLGRFFKVHKISCSTLTLACTERDIRKISMYLPFTAGHLHFSASVPDRTVFQHWPSNARVRTLSFQMAIDDQEIWPLLEEVDNATTPITLQMQLFVSSDCGPFSWSKHSPDEQYRNFIGRLTPHALALKMKGVEIVDEDGFTLTMYKA